MPSLSSSIDLKNPTIPKSSTDFGDIEVKGEIFSFSIYKKKKKKKKKSSVKMRSAKL